MFEMPFLMSAAMMDAMLGNTWRTNNSTTSKHARKN
jgi:hypothetical protein